MVKRVSTDFKIDGFAVRGLSRTAEFFCFFGMARPAGDGTLQVAKAGKCSLSGEKCSKRAERKLRALRAFYLISCLILLINFTKIIL